MLQGGPEAAEDSDVRDVLTYLGTQLAIGGGLTIVGTALLPAIAVGVLAILAIAGFRAAVSGELLGSSALDHPSGGRVATAREGGAPARR